MSADRRSGPRMPRQDASARYAPTPPPLPAFPQALEDAQHPSQTALALCQSTSKERQGTSQRALLDARRHSDELALHRPNQTASVKVLSVLTDHAGLRTGGHELRVLAQRAGCKAYSLEGAEKLDLLVFLSNRIQDNVNSKGKMQLALVELNTFLEREGMSPEKKNAKSTINELLELRRRELLRLDHTRLKQHESSDESFRNSLMDMSQQEVSDCFALVPYTETVSFSDGPQRSRGCSIM